MTVCRKCHSQINSGHFTTEMERGKELCTCERCLSKQCSRCLGDIKEPGYKWDYIHSDGDNKAYVCVRCQIQDDLQVFKSRGVITPNLLAALKNHSLSLLLGDSAERLRRNLANLHSSIAKLERAWWPIRAQILKSGWSDLKDDDSRILEIRVNNQAGVLKITIQDHTQNAVLVLDASEFSDHLEIASINGSPSQIRHLIASIIGLISHRGVYLDLVQDWDR